MTCINKLLYGYPYNSFAPNAETQALHEVSRSISETTCMYDACWAGSPAAAAVLGRG